MDEEKLRQIIKEEIGTNLKSMADSLKPKEKKTDYVLIIAWITVAVACMYLLYKNMKKF